MAFITAAAIMAGTSLVGGLIQGDASQQAAGQAAGAANQATNAQLQMFNTTNAQAAPWRQAGQNALNEIGTGLGFQGAGQPQGAPTNSVGGFDQASYNAALAAWQNGGATYDAGGPGQYTTPAGPMPTTDQFTTQSFAAPQTGSNPVVGINPGQFTHMFTNADLNSNLAPNYNWQVGQATGALANEYSGTQGLISGNTMRDIGSYIGNSVAGPAYQNAFSNYTNQQQNIFNRLSNIAGMGGNIASNTQNVGAQTGAGIANSTIAGGQSQALGTMGMANAISGGLNNAAGNWFGLNYLNNMQTVGGAFNPPGVYTPGAFAGPVQG